MEIHRPASHYKGIYIVNNNYNHYGNSVLSSINSNSVLSNHGFNPGGTHNNNINHNNSNSNTNHSLISTTSSTVSVKREQCVREQTAKKRPKFSYRSLLLPESLNVKKFLNRLDNDSVSVFSGSSRFVPLTVNHLPLEVMKLVLFYVGDYETSINCLYVNKNFNKAAQAIVYETPFLTSTYRLAQFVSTLREKPSYGELVKNLDLSCLTAGLLIGNQNDNGSIRSETDEDVYLDYALASWRDWKYKGDPLYGSSLLNSYNLSKSKSTVSVDSLSTVTSVKLKLFRKFKNENNALQDFHLIKFKKIAKLFKLKRNSSTTASQLKAKMTYSRLNNKSSPSSKTDAHELPKNVKFNIRDAKSQPFSDPHPYTNKFLLKYSSSKDIPIGHLIYLIELCPNLISLNISSVSLSLDFKIVYPIVNKTKFHSLVEDVLPKNNSVNSIDHFSGIRNGRLNKYSSKPANTDILRPNYMSDANVHFNMKNFHDQFIKLTEADILEKIKGLCFLQHLDLSSISWINYKSLKKLIEDSNFVKNGSLKTVDLTDSGMLRDLNWAKKFDNLDDFKEYFKGDVEQDVEEEDDEATLFLRTLGMNY